MKTNSITLLALFFLISFSAFAEGEEDVAKENSNTNVSVEAALPSNDLIVINLKEKQELGLPEDIREQFQETISYPENAEAVNEEELVVVGFTYDDDGYINVNQSASSNKSFEDHVISNIEKIRLRNGSVTIGKTYYAKFSFQRL